MIDWREIGWKQLNITEWFIHVYVKIYKSGIIVTLLEKTSSIHFTYVKGTAGSIGLHELTSIAREKLELLNEDSNKQWTQSEWKKFLAPFIESVHFIKKMIQ